MVIKSPYAFFTFVHDCDTLVVRKEFADREGETLTGKGCHTGLPAIGGGFDVPFWGVFCLSRKGKAYETSAGQAGAGWGA